MAKLYVVGDSTLASFNDVTYYYPRYGYATYLDKYLNIDVLNYALSGRSSRSYIDDKEYNIVFNSIEKGDYLLIGFSHNDEKKDDNYRYSSATLDINDKLSIQYVINEYYIKKAKEKGASVIIASPVIRLNKDNIYQGLDIHESKEFSYPLCLKNLAEKTNSTFIDLTNAWLNYVKDKDYSELSLTHAMTQGIKKNNVITYDITSTDKTHLNMLGANLTSYFFVNILKNTNSTLKEYIKDNINEPSIKDLSVNPKYEYIEYVSPNFTNYIKENNFDIIPNFYATSFGQFKTDILKDDNAYIKLNDNKIIMNIDDNGKFNSTSDSGIFLFNQIDYSYNFIGRCNIEVLDTLSLKQSAFGLMLRDSVTLGFNNRRCASNFICAGLITSDRQTNIIFSRENPTELKKEENIIDTFFNKGDVLDLKIERLGQKITVEVIYNNIRYTKMYFDFDLIKEDLKYVYLGVFLTSGVKLLVSNLSVEKTTLAWGA